MSAILNYFGRWRHTADHKRAGPLRPIMSPELTMARWWCCCRGAWGFAGPKTSSLERHIRLLEEAISPSTPREAVEKWAETRNWALQYAVIYPELREVARCLVVFDSSTSTGPTVARISVERDKNRARLSRHMSEERWHVGKDFRKAGVRLLVKGLD
jgi:hypothetical protein